MKQKSKPLILKSHKVRDLFCPNCNEFVSGNGSGYFPYTCQCGSYRYDMDTNQWILKPLKVKK